MGYNYSYPTYNPLVITKVFPLASGSLLAFLYVFKGGGEPTVSLWLRDPLDIEVWL